MFRPASRHLSHPANAVIGSTDYLQTVGELARDLRELGLAPVLVGGMALVVLGSRRVTRDFDFVVTEPGGKLERTLDRFYDRGLELVSRLDGNGEPTATIDNRRVAATRIRIDTPATAYFYNPKTGLRVDLLFDFPIPAKQLAERSRRLTIQRQVFDIASDQDLLELKRIASAARSAPGDVEDIRFLEARRTDGTS
jgi:hypothetical protein